MEDNNMSNTNSSNAHNSNLGSEVNMGAESAASSDTRLKVVLKNTFDDLASVRAKKYVLSDEGFDQRLSDVCDTINAIRSTLGTEVDLNGESYPIKDYQIPKALVNYVSSGLIYGSSDAVGKVDPIIQIKKAEAKLSPLVFNKFFADFNGYQADGYKIPVVDAWNRLTTVSLEDVQYLEDKSGRMAKLHENGFDIQTCWLIGLSVEGLCQYLSKYDAPTKDGMTRWLSQA
jgi:hypothetical protein